MANIESRSFRIPDLIRQVRRGELRVPRFQRAFVWKHEQVIALLESLRARYPIGTLFVWRTPDRYASIEKVGAVRVPIDAPPEPAPVGYLLDGHQRVSCLVGVLGVRDDEARLLVGADRVFLVYYDLRLREFVHQTHPQKHHLPARYLLPAEADDSDPLTDWLDERREPTARGTDVRNQWDQYRRDALAIQTTFGQYLVRYDDVTEADLDEAVDIFRLVNRQGTPAKPEEVFAALTWRPNGFDFAARTKEIVAANTGFETLDSSLVLRALMCSLGESVYERSWSDVQQKHGKVLAAQMNQVADALARAINFLRNRVGAKHARVVPYGLQVVVLTRFHELCQDPDVDQLARLERWFWATSYGAVYGGAGGLALDDHLKRAERLAKGELLDVLPSRPALQPLPRRFHPRSARVRALHLFLATLDPLDPRTGGRIPDPLSHGLVDVRPVVPGDNAWRLGARVLIGQGGGDPRRRLLFARQALASQEILRSHAIPPAAFDALEADDDEAFITSRHRYMAELETIHALQFVTGPGSEPVVDEPDLDADDIPDL